METLVIATVLVVIHFMLHERIGINSRDEGFLWNGVIRTASGLIPIRDFKSYDPGRFYWTSYFTRFFGRGIIGVRMSVALFQLIGLWAGLDVMARMYESWVSLFLIGALLLWWMEPRHKRFEHSISLICIWAALQLFENSSNLNYYFAAGGFIGFAAFMGRNHGVYALLSFIIFFVTLNTNTDLYLVFDQGVHFIVGIIVGYLPMLLMWLFIPDMFKRYFTDKVGRILAGKVLKHVKLEFPWPWKADRKNPNKINYISDVLVGSFFIILPICYLGSILYYSYHNQSVDPAIMTIYVSSVIGVFYLHHGLIRADLPHLCQVTQPFLILVISIVSLQQSAITGGLIIVFLVFLSGLLVIPLNPLVDIYRFPERYTKTRIKDDLIYVDTTLAENLESIKSYVDFNLSPGDTMFIAPDFPILYPILGLKTPVFSDYMLFPESDSNQEELIADLKKNKVEHLLISNHCLDGKDELRFSNTHRRVWQHILDNYEVRDINKNIAPSFIFYAIKGTEKN